MSMFNDLVGKQANLLISACLTLPNPEIFDDVKSGMSPTPSAPEIVDVAATDQEDSASDVMSYLRQGGLQFQNATPSIELAFYPAINS